MKPRVLEVPPQASVGPFSLENQLVAENETCKGGCIVAGGGWWTLVERGGDGRLDDNSLTL